MADYSSILAKIADLKAKVLQDSISPSYLGTILDEMARLAQSGETDNDDTIKQLTADIAKIEEYLDMGHLSGAWFSIDNGTVTFETSSNKPNGESSRYKQDLRVSDKSLPSFMSPADKQAVDRWVDKEEAIGRILGKEVMEFNGIVSNVKIETTSASSVDEVFYDKYSNRFVGYRNGLYYNNWPGANAVWGNNDAKGFLPREGRLYHDAAAHNLYDYTTDDGLKSIGSDVSKTEFDLLKRLVDTLESEVIKKGEVVETQVVKGAKSSSVSAHGHLLLAVDYDRSTVTGKSDVSDLTDAPFIYMGRRDSPASGADDRLHVVNRADIIVKSVNGQSKVVAAERAGIYLSNSSETESDGATTAVDDNTAKVDIDEDNVMITHNKAVQVKVGSSASVSVKPEFVQLGYGSENKKVAVSSNTALMYHDKKIILGDGSDDPDVTLNLDTEKGKLALQSSSGNYFKLDSNSGDGVHARLHAKSGDELSMKEQQTYIKTDDFQVKTHDGAKMIEAGEEYVKMRHSADSNFKLSDKGMEVFAPLYIKDVDDSVQDVLAKLSAPIPQLFIDLWNDFCIVNQFQWGKYDYENAPDKSKPFVLLDVWLTYKEALIVYNSGKFNMQIPNNTIQPSYYKDSRAKVLPPLFASGYNNTNLLEAFAYCGNLEVCAVIDRYINSVDRLNEKETSIIATRDAFTDCYKLREVKGILKMPTSDTLGVHFYNSERLYVLETIKLTNVHLDIPELFGRSPYVSLETFDFLVKNATNTEEITITVHADVYAKLVDTGNEEWNKVLTDAAARQITFAQA